MRLLDRVPLLPHFLAVIGHDLRQIDARALPAHESVKLASISASRTSSPEMPRLRHRQDSVLRS